MIFKNTTKMLLPDFIPQCRRGMLPYRPHSPPLMDGGDADPLLLLAVWYSVQCSWTHEWHSDMRLVSRSWVPWCRLSCSPTPRQESSSHRLAVRSIVCRRCRARLADSRCIPSRSRHSVPAACDRSELPESWRLVRLSTQHGTLPCHSSLHLYLSTS